MEGLEEAEYDNVPEQEHRYGGPQGDDDDEVDFTYHIICMELLLSTPLL